MATLLTANNLSKTYGTHTLFEGVSVALSGGDRVGLIGPNGAGKSTLLKILGELETPDEGDLIKKRSLKVAYVKQQDAFEPDATPMSTVANYLNGLPCAAVQQLDPETRAAIALSRLGFADHDVKVDTLSGGWKKRLSIACAVASEPDILMLDEPTNHLDLEGVVWLEQFVSSQLPPGAAVVFVTHDRAFLESVANRITELSRAYPEGTLSVEGNYSEFIRRKEEFLDAQESQARALAGKVRRDTAWLQQGIKGRQTRNKTQLEDTKRRRSELDDLKARNAAPDRKTKIAFDATGRQTRKLIEVKNVSKSLGGKNLFEGVELLLGPGVRLGLLGPNGAGKTTFLKTITQTLEPDTGTVKHADNLRVVHFTQHREQLDPATSLREALCPVGDVVHYQDKEIHVASWAQRFLFDHSQFNTSVGDLSGGEQSRILIANLMLLAADVLILDEPTNDLDIPSLDVLEDALMTFPGAIVLVSHDRFMLQRLSTDVLALDGHGTGGWKMYADYLQWQNDPTRRPPETAAEKSNGKKNKGGSKAKEDNRPAKKLSYKMQRELEGMEQAILEAEDAVEALQTKTNDPDLIADHVKYTALCNKLGKAHQKVEDLYARWTELEAMRA